MSDADRPQDEQPPSRAPQAETSEGAGFTAHDAGPRAGGEEQLPAVDFATFVLSLATSALYHLGLTEGPEGETTPEKNLPLARQTIDTLEMLEVKTAGNLEVEEAKLLQSVLYELRMGYVKASG
jgi:hypothetical protein